jgi:5-methylthioadenosine/S-adenosylhomocysteine deaminase
VSPKAKPARKATKVVYFDLVGTLVTALRAPRPATSLEPWLGDAWRRGVLCNLPVGDARTVLRTLEAIGLDGLFDPDLLIVATNLPTPLPDHRAFAAAAALAEVTAKRCTYVSADPTLREAAAAAGMTAAEPPAPPAEPIAAPVPNLLGDVGASPTATGRKASGKGKAKTTGKARAGRKGKAATASSAAATTAAAPPTSPTYVLTGRVVTMNAKRDVIDDGQVAIADGQIVAVASAKEKLPAAFASAPVIKTGGTLYPGLIDLHNHFVYNVLSLWPVPQRYDDRAQWPRNANYPREVTLPVRALAQSAPSARALVRYVEAKALVGGTTTGQGIRTQVNGGPKLFQGAMRTVEVTGDPRLPEAGTMVPSLYVNAERVKAFKHSLETRSAYFYHLAEGVDEAARRTFKDLADNDLLAPSLVGIHCLGLQPEDLTKFVAAGAKTVWSPLSNLLLYGRTHDLAQFLDSKVPLALGCDWSPSGSKNLLQELKVARWVADQQKADLPDDDLVAMVTSTPAAMLRWAPYVGTLGAEAYADILVIDGAGGDPYAQLIAATEADVSLLLVGGVGRYGTPDLVEAVHPAPEQPLETWKLGRSPRAFNFFAPESELNDVTLAAATKTLSDAVADLPTFREKSQEEAAKLSSFGIEAPSFTVDLDNEYEPTPDELEEAGGVAALAADWSQIAGSIPLDTLRVAEPAYWKELKAASNLPAGLAAAVQKAYG